jgi:hypothetical protein
VATNQPFTIVILGGEETPELAALSSMGHTLIYCSSLKFAGIEGEIKVDQVVGPNCWRLLPDQMKWVPLMAKEMRALQPKPKKVKKGKTNDDGQLV